MRVRGTRNWGAVAAGAALCTAMLVTPVVASADDGTVSTVAELQAAVESLPAGAARVTLGNDFAAVAEPPIITLPPGVRLTLAGDDVTVTKVEGSSGRHLNFAGDGSQTVAVTGLTFVGFNDPNPAGQAGGVSGGGLGIARVSEVTISESTFAGIDGSAGLALDRVPKLTVTDSSFLGNRAAAGAAVELPSGVSATFVRTTMHKNWGTQAGYSGGALRPVGKSTITIENSLFTENVSLTRGGAIAFFQMEGSLTVRDSVFAGNRVPLAASNTTVNDGGAIAVNEHPDADPQTGTTRIVGSTFRENVAADEGGALLIQSGNGSSAVIQNSTFFANRAEGAQEPLDDVNGGGAIEAFGTPVTLEHNTFVNNTAHKGNAFVPQRGGAVSATGDRASLPVQPLTLSHNLFVGNDVLTASGDPAPNSAYRQVSARGGIETPAGRLDTESALDESPDAPKLTRADLEPRYEELTEAAAQDAGEPGELVLSGTNVGVDNGDTIDYEQVSRLAVFGDDAIAPAPNGSTVIAGDARTGDTQTPGTMQFLPGDGAYLTGVADGVAPAAPGITEDQRGFPVDEPADAGALQQAFIRYDPNGGDWESLAEQPFDGTRIVQRDGTALVWAVGPVGAELATEPAPTTVPQGKLFAGWNTAADGSGEAVPAGTVAVRAGNLRLYAQWKDEVPPAKDGTVRVEYVDDGGAALRDPIELTGPVGEPYMTEKIMFEGYDLVRVEGIPAGKFAAEAVTVRYHYQATTVLPPVGTGTVVSSYVDTAGKALRSPLTHTGKIGAAYQTQQLKFSGYSFVRVDGKAAGSFTQTPIAVTYVYEAKGAVTTPPPVSPPAGSGTATEQAGPLVATGLSSVWSFALASGVALLVAAGVFLLGRRRASRTGAAE